MRAFLALEIPRDIKEYLSIISKRMSQVVPGVKWVKSEGLHVTLKFFGEINDTMAKGIGDALTGIGGQQKAATVQLNEISAFPDVRRARVVVVTFQEGVDNVQTIFHDIESRLAVLETPDSEYSSGQGQAPGTGQFERVAPRAFIPHITLGRARGAVPLIKKDIILLEKKRFVIDTVVLFRSTLTQSGAIYTPLKEIKLERNF